MDFDKQKLLLILNGINTAKKAFTGPVEVHIDLTNSCNNNCIGCWCRSPLLGELEMAPESKRQKLSYHVIRILINDLADMGVKKIKLTGGGEPFMYPHIIKVIKEIKDNNMLLDINTNFTLVTRPILRKICDTGIDSLTVSIWAGTEETYTKLHPKMKPLTFKKIKENLAYLSNLKEISNSKIPFINIYNVILNLNFQEIDKIIDFAFETKTDATQLVVLDPIPGKTDKLLLNKEQKDFVLEKLKVILKNFDPVSQKYRISRGKSIMIPGLIGEFIRRLSNQETEKGVYDSSFISQNPCYVGWLFSRIMASGDVIPCLKAHKFSLGNINKKSFKKIWYSKKYEEFRNKSVLSAKQDKFFKNMGNDKYGCYKTCDNIWQNEAMNDIIVNTKYKIATSNLYNLNLYKNQE